MNLVFIIIGLAVMFTKRISVSSSTELRRPRTFVFGLIIIIAGFLASFADAFSNPYGTNYAPVIVYGLAMFFPIIAALFLKQPKLTTGEVSNQPVKSKMDKVAHTATWAILTIIGLGALFFLFVLIFLD